MNETINSAPRMMLTYRGPNTGCHLKMKLATSVSTTSLAVAFGGDVRTALLMDEAYVGFGFFGRSLTGCDGTRSILITILPLLTHSGVGEVTGLLLPDAVVFGWPIGVPKPVRNRSTRS